MAKKTEKGGKFRDFCIYIVDVLKKAWGELSMGIRLDKLVVKFGDFKALNEVTLQIPKGKLVSLLGPSGSGKSTTLFTISGIHKPHSGKIYFGDRDVTGLEPEELGIGLVFQNYALYPHMTVKENILFPLKNLKWDKVEAEKRAIEVAKIVKIESQLDKKPSQLSGGQQQRVAIARALAKKPDILLLDEPLSNLDTKLRVETRQEIRRIQKETGVTAIFVTHDQEEAMCISDGWEWGTCQAVDAKGEGIGNPKG